MKANRICLRIVVPLAHPFFSRFFPCWYSLLTLSHNLFPFCGLAFVLFIKKKIALITGRCFLFHVFSWIVCLFEFLQFIKAVSESSSYLLEDFWVMEKDSFRENTRFIVYIGIRCSFYEFQSFNPLIFLPLILKIYWLKS